MTTKPAAHPICPVCKLEALKLVEHLGDTYCPWCVPDPRLGKPFDASRWQTILDALTIRLREVAA